MKLDHTFEICSRLEKAEKYSKKLEKRHNKIPDMLEIFYQFKGWTSTSDSEVTMFINNHVTTLI